MIWMNHQFEERYRLSYEHITSDDIYGDFFTSAQTQLDA
jgi:hypothetical protein